MLASLKKATLTPKAMRTARSRWRIAQEPARIDERRDEEQRERDPHERRVDLAPERAGVAAGHRPRDLRPGPRLGHLPGRVADVDLRDLLGVLAAREVVADLPARAGLLEDVVVDAACAAARVDRGRRAVGDRLGLAPGEPVAHGRAVHALGPDEVVGVGRGGRQQRERRGRADGRDAGGARHWSVSVTTATACAAAGRCERPRPGRVPQRRPRAPASASPGQAPKWPRTIGATSAIDHDPWSCGASTPQKASAPSESTRCSEPWLPPPTWSTPPQSANS